MKIVDGKCQVEDCSATQLVVGETMTYCCTTKQHIQLKNPKNRENYRNLIAGLLTDDKELVTDSMNKIERNRNDSITERSSE